MSSREVTSLRQRWTSYQDLPTLTEHWYWRPGWHAGRHFYAWHLTFQQQPALHHHGTVLQQQLTLPGLDPVPLDGPHLPMVDRGNRAPKRGPVDVRQIRNLRSPDGRCFVSAGLGVALNGPPWSAGGETAAMLEQSRSC
ncbi:hypothetical protein OOK41_03795 [Micromonospora sp. NBC_01655]|uniref:hypothetical protein n=1 Tax=Micromonospora sp. NBC_01655 TaxID=2975983 RepID=UPI0022525199|nr:hypothetical protein [Micromonospora sp. NBC_01655]MCX4469434.1 hypothetical protein [Micromonospora sp. NBC_01655]